MREVLIAVRDQLRESLSIEPAMCAIRPKENPPAWCGDLFLSVFQTSIGVGGEFDLNVGTSLAVGVGVCITRKSAYIPTDFESEGELDKFHLDFSSLVVRVIRSLDKNWQVNKKANSLLVSFPSSKYTEPLRFTGADVSPISINGSWFEGSTSDTLNVGFKQTVRFSDMRRIIANTATE